MFHSVEFINSLIGDHWAQAQYKQQLSPAAAWSFWDDWDAYNLDATFEIPTGSIRGGVGRYKQVRHHRFVVREREEA